MRIKFQVCRLIPKKSFDLHYMKKRFVLSVIVILIELYLISILFLLSQPNYYYCTFWLVLNLPLHICMLTRIVANLIETTLI